MSDSHSRRRDFLGLSTAAVAIGLFLGVGGPFSMPRVAAGDEQASPLQKALNRTQQDLMDLRSNLRIDGRTTKALAVEDLKGILRVLEKAVDRANPNDPCLAAAHRTREFLMMLINGLEHFQLNGRKALAEELDLLIGVLDGILGKW